jgi:hypothetical protein
MNRSVRFEPEADDELQISIANLEFACGLGEQFRAEVQCVVARIAADPFRFRRTRGDVRRAYVPRFKHWIYFLIETEEIAIAAVFHCSRDPEELQKRGLL